MAFFYFVCFDWVVTVLMNCEMYYANGASGIYFFIIYFCRFYWFVKLGWSCVVVRTQPLEFSLNWNSLTLCFVFGLSNQVGNKKEVKN